MGLGTTDIALHGIPAVDLNVRKPSARAFLYTATDNGNRAVRSSLDYAFRKGSIGYDWEDLWKAFQADGYLHRAVLRYRNLVVGDGVQIDGDREAVRYLQERFAIGKSLNGFGWDELVRTLALEYVLYGNAFLIRSYTGQLSAVFGRRLRVARATAAWYPVTVRWLEPLLDRNTRDVVGWQLRIKEREGTPKTHNFRVQDVIHLWYNCPPGGIYGIPPLLSAVEDVRALRQIEEDVLKLVHKYTHPLIQVTMADTLGYGEGVRADVTELVSTINTMAEDGFLVTMPGQEVRMIGAESMALRVEPYVDLFKRRVFSSLGMSGVMLGDQPEPLERQVELERHLRDTVQDLQIQFGQGLLHQVILPLLREAGFSGRTQVRLRFPVPDRSLFLRQMTQLANIYTLNVLGAAEVRRMMGIDEPLDQNDTYSARVTLPRILEPIRLQAQLGVAAVRPPAGGDRAPGAAGRPIARSGGEGLLDPGFVSDAVLGIMEANETDRGGLDA